MDPERWARVRTIFERAVELDGDERRALLDAECDDEELRAEVESLLAGDERSFEVTPVLEGGTEPPTQPLEIGGYRILRQLGAGGMGTVFEAEQDRPSRRVALKLMAVGLRSDTARRRFLDESDTLARLRHPGIAQVYEVGEHPDPLGGPPLPFFAMELVPGGRDALQWRDGERPSDRAIASFIADACDAVHHGHVHGVVHRDLKPGNILVDPEGRPKVIDFGIARWTGGEDRTLLTAAGQVVGTLPYMSPEQVTGADVDARSDVYSLGVVAYRMLGGELPIEVGTDIASAAREIAEREPLLLGARNARLRGDLETIVSHALEKEPERRYQSASELAADLRRYLADQPITARPASTIYQLRKLARRHRLAVATSFIAVVAVLVALVVSVVQGVRIRAEQERTGKISTFLGRILSEADAMDARGPDYTIREALDGAAARIDTELGGDPLLEAAVRHVVGRTYLNLSLIVEAAPHIERAYRLRRQHLGDDALETLDSLGELVLLRREQARPDDALVLAERLLASREQAGPSALEQRAYAVHNLAQVAKDVGQRERAEGLYREALAWRLANLGPDDPSTLSTQHNLGALLLDTGRLDLAEEALTTTLEGRTRVLGGRSPYTAITLDVLGRVQRSLGRVDDAIQSHRAALGILESRLGPDHTHSLAAGQHLGWALLEAGRPADAVGVAARAAAGSARVFGESDPRTLHVMRIEAASRAASGDVEVAEQVFRRVVERSRDRFGGDDRRTRDAIADLAILLRNVGRPDDAVELLDPVTGDDAPADPALIHGLLARSLCLGDLGRMDATEAALMRAYEVATSLDAPEARAVAAYLAAFHGAQGDDERAATWAERAEAGSGRCP